VTEDDLKAFEANMKRIKGAVGGDGVSERGSSRKSGSNPAPPPTSQIFFVPGPLPGANDIIRKHYMIYSTLKSQWGLTIARCIIVAKLKRVQACTIHFLWQERHNRRDDDNIMFGQKFVLDALRDTRIIPDDRRQFVQSLTHRITIDPTNPGVWVRIENV
jgi:Holliday junction resolvase RusA-like endonuclease